MCLGIPARITGIADAAAMLADVDVHGVRRQVDVLCVAPPDAPLEELVGSWVLVHVGFAMSRISEPEARATLALLAEMGELQEELTAMQASGTTGGPHAVQ
ncbi:HypC/HybG/HupF family hydrogenase formation chaperone [Acetobacter papayae]|uniref:HypC/HybG/HupF family hydrogenase formation chaperone n=1 Tax=Acetobacter papayae TaxID=1076592 RepID=UPI0039EBDE90